MYILNNLEKKFGTKYPNWHKGNSKYLYRNKYEQICERCCAKRTFKIDKYNNHYDVTPWMLNNKNHRTCKIKDT